MSVLVEIPASDYDDWSEQSDIVFTLAHRLNHGEGNFILSYLEVPNNTLFKYNCLTPEGGI